MVRFNLEELQQKGSTGTPAARAGWTIAARQEARCHGGDTQGFLGGLHIQYKIVSHLLGSHHTRAGPGHEALAVTADLRWLGARPKSAAQRGYPR